MNKFFKAGLLIVTLVIPALIFTFLRFFATNHYDLPYYHAEKDSAGNVRVINGDTVFYKVADSLGRKLLPPGGIQGKVIVLSYLPQICSDSCKEEFIQLDRIYGLRQSIPYLNLATFTREWPKDSMEFCRGIGKSGWQVNLLPSREEEIQFFDRFQFETKVPKAKTNSRELKLVLIDDNGYIRGYYIGADSEEIDRLMAEIKILDYEKNNKK
jgi:protein SCO1/2